MIGCHDDDGGGGGGGDGGAEDHFPDVANHCGPIRGLVPDIVDRP